MPRVCDPAVSGTVDTARDMEPVMQDVKPDLTIVDSLFMSAQDAAQRLGVRWVIASPNTLFELVRQAHGLRAFTWPM